MGVAVTPTEFLKHHLDPISGTIDSFGGPHVLMGLVASGGQPHIYIIGNLDKKPTLRSEIYEELGKKLLEMSKEKQSSGGVVLPGPGSIIR